MVFGNGISKSMLTESNEGETISVLALSPVRSTMNLHCQMA